MTTKTIRKILIDRFGSLLDGHEYDPLELVMAATGDEVLVAARLYNGMCPLLKIPVLDAADIDILQEIVAHFNEHERDAALLKKYVNFVYREEGTTFISVWRRSGHFFTDAEWAQLEAIDREIEP